MRISFELLMPLGDHAVSRSREWSLNGCATSVTVPYSLSLSQYCCELCDLVKSLSVACLLSHCRTKKKFDEWRQQKTFGVDCVVPTSVCVMLNVISQARSQVGVCSEWYYLLFWQVVGLKQQHLQETCIRKLAKILTISREFFPKFEIPHTFSYVFLSIFKVKPKVSRFELWLVCYNFVHLFVRENCRFSSWQYVDRWRKQRLTNKKRENANVILLRQLLLTVQNVMNISPELQISQA